MEELIAPLVTAALGFVGGLFTPLVKWKVEAARNLAAARREKIQDWRDAITFADFNDERSLKEFASSAVYSSLRGHMLDTVISSFEKQRTFYVGGGRGDDVRKHMLLDEVARLEKKWDLV